MAKLTIDLSGTRGLAPRYFGDRSSAAATPQLRTIASKDMYASGIVNPMARTGYLSPASNTFTDSGILSFNAELSATIVDTLNGKGYFAERSNQLYSSSTLRAAPALLRALAGSGVVLTDLESIPSTASGSCSTRTRRPLAPRIWAPMT